MIIEKKSLVLYVNRVSKTTTGGRRQSFSSIVAVSSGRHSIGIGFGKGSNYISSIKNAEASAEKNIINIPCKKNTITHDVTLNYGATKIVLKSVYKSGVGVVAGGIARSIFQMAEINDVVCKIVGSTNPYLVCHALINAFKELNSLKSIANRLEQTNDQILRRKLFFTRRYNNEIK